MLYNRFIWHLCSFVFILSILFDMKSELRNSIYRKHITMKIISVESAERHNFYLLISCNMPSILLLFLFFLPFPFRWKYSQAKKEKTTSKSDEISGIEYYVNARVKQWRERKCLTLCANEIRKKKEIMAIESIFCRCVFQCSVSSSFGCEVKSGTVMNVDVSTFFDSLVERNKTVDMTSSLYVWTCAVVCEKQQQKSLFILSYHIVWCRTHCRRRRHCRDFSFFFLLLFSPSSLFGWFAHTTTYNTNTWR